MLSRICPSISSRARLLVTSSRLQSSNVHSKCEGLSIEAKNQVLWVKFNRPKKFNAITAEMYDQLTETFNQVNEDKSIKAVVVTGEGDYYSSGNDLSNLTKAAQDEAGPQVGLNKCKNIMIRFVDSIINAEKLLIAAVNGPAVGIPVSTLPLFDYVLASDNATFTTPFTSLGQCPEACSSITFPQIMGHSRASELLLMNMTWSAKKAQNYGLVSDVIEKDKLATHLEEFLYGKRGIIENCYPQSLKVSRGLLRHSGYKQTLLEANRRESEAIYKAWLSQECADALQKFMSRFKKA